jgi:two-component sensor histidine kinase/PAS domain-containing protein
MPPPLSEFERQQLDVIARVTPHAMLGHILNTTVLAAAVAGSIPTVHLIVWCAYSYAVALLLLYRHARSRGRAPRSFRRAALRAKLYGLLLALPWSSMAVLHLGGLGHDQELVLVAIGVGMAASGTVLLSAVPLAAFSYMSAVLLPAAVKCLFLVNQGGYIFLGMLAVSYWWFLSALIAKVSREIGERKQADLALKDSEVRLQEALDAGQVVAFTWDPASGLSQRSANAPRVLGLPSHAGPDWGPGSFLERVHGDDRACFAAQVKALSPEKPSYSAAFRFIRPEGQEVWLEETGKAEFDGDRRYLRLRGLTRDITESKRAEERQRQLVHELDHRVKNVLASVATVAHRTSEGSPSMEEFLRGFDGRVQAMANAHALLSRSRWQGAQLADLVLKELAPWAGKGNTSVEGPDVLLFPVATQPFAVVLHELATNASKYGALTAPQGRIAVRWSLQRQGEGGVLVLDWVETGGPPVSTPGEAGYGTGAIRNLIPYELGGRVDLAFDAQGVRCRIELPSSRVREGTETVDLFKIAVPPHAQAPSEALSP